LDVFQIHCCSSYLFSVSWIRTLCLQHWFFRSFHFTQTLAVLGSLTGIA
jgi:hypothetical protein